MCKWSAVPKSEVGTISRAGRQALLAQMAVAQVMGVRLTELCAETRGGPAVAFARQTAMYLCRVGFEMTLNEIALAFGRDRTTAAYAVARIEEARENPEFDRALLWLEATLCRAGESHG